ncbi:ABC transporter ATP-binding protein [Paenibacillus lemnae]|uniref:ABC transporter ATP-binding protein n=1 Tax=Paenibacillus lemnae TaxID=1330551 RepID=A0A848M748_PAELE|nr:ABC transporter ATP-binding protein [Paenibacillus lemnae]NMO95673.1 ABC transporter ATP-binding protein [Paenibacillus lemnae]
MADLLLLQADDAEELAGAGEADSEAGQSGPRPSVSVQDLRLKFPGDTPMLFRDLSFQASAGEKVLLLGPSGCGKSTLLQVLSGMIPRVIEIPMKCSEQIIPASWAYVFQDPDTQFCMPFVDEELAFVLENLQVARDDMAGRMKDALDAVGLQLPELHTPISSLSQGMKQRLALASALLLEPEVLFLDEPSALLDPEGRKQIWEAVRSVSADRTLVIVEHRIEEILHDVNRVILFGPDGEIVGEGRPEEVFIKYRKELQQYGIWHPGVWEDYRAAASERSAVSRGFSSVSEGPAVGVNPGAGESPVLALSQFQVLRKQRPVVTVEEASLYPGDFTAVIGHNGAGKSSLLLGLMGLLPCTGDYRLGGEPVVFGKKRRERKMREHALRRIGFVFQNPELQFVSETVLDEVLYSLVVDGRSQEEAIQEAHECLAHFGLSGMEGRHPYQLSMGQKRRLSVATAMVRKPEVLLLDEPTFGQDARNTFGILELCQELVQAGTAILMVTHEMDIAQQVAREIWEIGEGRLLSRRKPEVDR